MYLRVKKWLLLYQYCQKGWKGIWVVSTWREPHCVHVVMSCTKSENVSHELPYADRAGWRWFKTLCTFFFAIIYIKYDLHDIAFFFFLNATISFIFSTLCFCTLDFTWQVTPEHLRYQKQVPRKWFRQIHSGSDLTGVSLWQHDGLENTQE